MGGKRGGGKRKGRWVGGLGVRDKGAEWAVWKGE